MTEALTFTIDAERDGARLDAYLAAVLPTRSRVQLRRIITAGAVLVDGQRAKPAYHLKAGQVIRIELPDLPRAGPAPEEIPLDVLYEDEHVAVINKPAGMVVHPAKGHWRGTLASALAWRFGQLSSMGGPSRPGIVHRLDRDTSGVIIVARNDEAHFALAAQFESRDVTKQYLALTAPAPDRDRDRIDKPIGPHAYQREKMAIREDHPEARAAETFYEVRERFAGFALVQLTPKTGRTHQIRVHLAHIGCPVLCDRLYGGRAMITTGEILNKADHTPLLDRQALHAWRLALRHPISKAPLQFEAPLPADMQRALDALRVGRQRK